MPKKQQEITPIRTPDGTTIQLTGYTHPATIKLAIIPPGHDPTVTDLTLFQAVQLAAHLREGATRLAEAILRAEIESNTETQSQRDYPPAPPNRRKTRRKGTSS
jgi:hypothetical protein